MSEFSDEQINELLQLFRDELGIEVSAEKACLHATQLLNLLLTAYRD
jgi:hypothetical protein